MIDEVFSSFTHLRKSHRLVDKPIYSKIESFKYIAIVLQQYIVFNISIYVYELFDCMGSLG